MKTVFSASDLVKALAGNVKTVRKYSGRGMFGDQCVGFTVDAGDSLSVVAQIVAAADPDSKAALANVFEGAKTDSMGRSDIIVYFPRLEWDDDCQKVVDEFELDEDDDYDDDDDS